MQEQDSNLFTEVSIDETAKRNIAGIVSWAMVVVVTAVIGYVLSVVSLFTTDSSEAVQSEGFMSYLSLGGDGAASVIISLVIGLVINFFLYRFATLAKGSLATQNQEQLANSFRNLKIYFAITAILMILLLLLFLLGVAAAL